MLEEIPIPENSREKLIAVLQVSGTEHEESQRLFTSFTEEREREISSISDEKERMHANFELSIEKALVLMEAGLLIDALAELTVTGEAAWDSDELEICDRIKPLMDSIEEKLLKE